MSRRKKILLYVAASCAAIILFTVLALPHIIRNKAAEAIKEATGRNTRIASVAINPFTLTLTVKGFAIDEPNTAPLVSVGSLRVSLSPVSLFKRSFIVSEVVIDTPSIAFARTAPNRYSFSDILERQPKEKKTEDGFKPLFSINNIQIINGSVDFDDRAVNGGRQHTVRKLDISIPFISNIPYLVNKYTTPRLRAVINGSEFDFSGKTKPLSKEMDTNIHISIKSLDLPMLMAYLPQKPPFTLLSGKLGVESDLDYIISSNNKPRITLNSQVRVDGISVKMDQRKQASKQPPPAFKLAGIEILSNITYKVGEGLQADKVNISLKELDASYGSKDGLKLALLAIRDVAFIQKTNSLTIGEILLSKGAMAITREADGSLSPMTMLPAEPARGGASAGKQAAKPAPKTSKTASPTEKELEYSLKKFNIDGFDLTLTDKAVEGHPRFKLAGINFLLEDLNGPRFTPAKLDFSAIFGKRAKLGAKGTILPQPFNYKGDLRIGRLPIQDFGDYMPDNINLEILSGYLDTRLKLDVSLKDGKPSGSFSGSSGLRAFHCIDTTAEEDLLKWESLQLDDYRGSIDPVSISIRQIALNGFYSRIIVQKDGTLNLQNLVDKPDEKTGTRNAESGTSEKAKNTGNAQQAPISSQAKTGQKLAVAGSRPPLVSSKSPTPGPQIKIGAVTIQGGTLSFTDNHLPQRFSTTFYNLGGRISGLSSEETRFAEVDLRGNLENHSPLQITGKINPLRDDLFVDLKVSFKDIELSPTTPYTGTYLGYTVDKGKLFLDLKYHIENKALNSENKIFVDQFTFGNRVESEKATSLPVKLGLALLKDRKGEIHLDVPVTGRIDDPEFSIWGLVFQVLKNLLVKAVTSPFSLISSMFGGGEDLSSIHFVSGTSALAKTGEIKLQALGKALAERPALKLELKAYVDREKDTEMYRHELLERKIRNEKYITLAKEGKLKQGADAASISVLPEEYSRYLKTVYKKEKFPKPRNVIGMLKDLPDAEMKKLIITNTLVGANELNTLAQERSTTVKNYLIGKSGVAAERIFQKLEDIYKKPAKEGASSSRVEMNIIVQ